MSDMTEEQLHAMVDSRNLEEGEPLFVVNSAWEDINLWLIENRPVVGTQEVVDQDESSLTYGQLITVNIQEPWDWEADSDTIVLFGHPVYSQGWAAAPTAEERDNAIDEAMVLGTGNVPTYADGVDVGFIDI